MLVRNLLAAAAVAAAAPAAAQTPIARPVQRPAPSALHPIPGIHQPNMFDLQAQIASLQEEVADLGAAIESIGARLEGGDELAREWVAVMPMAQQEAFVLNPTAQPLPVQYSCHSSNVDLDGHSGTWMVAANDWARQQVGQGRGWCRFVATAPILVFVVNGLTNTVQPAYRVR